MEITDTRYVPCPGCECDMEAGQPIPNIDDGDQWAALEARHSQGCLWIATRAYRVVPRT